MPDPGSAAPLERYNVDVVYRRARECRFPQDFHGYPWLIHRLAYRRTNHRNFHVRGYKERGNINTPLELAIQNEIDRFSIAIDVIDRVPKLQVAGAHAKERLRDMQIGCRVYAHEHGVDVPEHRDWVWPGS